MQMIMNRLKKELQEKRILHAAQGAFQHRKSTIDQAAFLCQRIQDGFNTKMTTLITFVDLRAAYDLVSRNILNKNRSK